jgi:hypothetical protein
MRMIGLDCIIKHYSQMRDNQLHESQMLNPKRVFQTVVTPEGRGTFDHSSLNEELRESMVGNKTWIRR